MHSVTMQILWIVVVISLIIWVAGLAAGWGGWVWVFFAIGLVLGDANILALRGTRR